MHSVLTKKIIGWATVILFAVAIVFFSSQSGSQSNHLSVYFLQQGKKAGDYVPDGVKDRIERIISNWEYGVDEKEIYKGGTDQNSKQPKLNPYWQEVVRDRKYNLILRKIAHFTEYFLLAFLFFIVLTVSKVRSKKALIITLLFCAVFASIDEFHQSFIPGREALLEDVMIDFAGSILAVITLFFITGIFKRFRFNGSKKYEIH